MKTQEGKHTPGPWTKRKHAMGAFVTAPNPNGGIHEITIAETRPANLGAFYQHQAEFNADLIAAAPKLLELVRRLLGCASSSSWAHMENHPCGCKSCTIKEARELVIPLIRQEPALLKAERTGGRE